MTCPACGAATAPEARFCAACGRSLQLVDERRVVTVVFADLVGFTTLSERLDPELVKNLVDRCFERLAEDVIAHGGQVDKVIGDALVALFGAPIAHEDDAERAVRAALRMQQTLDAEAALLGLDLRMRIGVNTGEVLVGAMRAAGSVTAMGDVVNTASRLQAAAKPGEVLVGAATHSATARNVAYEPRGLMEAKGREDAVEVWAAVSPVAPPGYRPRREEVPLVGRDIEVEMLRRSVDLSVGNRRGGLILLLGDVGLGKSRLADEVAQWSVDQHRAVVRHGRCVPYGEANVWWPITEAIHSALGLSDRDDRVNVRKALIAEVARVDPSISGSEAEQVAEGLLPLMGFDTSGGASPASVQGRAARALAAYLTASSLRRPVVLKLSDLHFGDDVVLSLLDDVLEEVHHSPVLVVATARSSLLERWAPRPGRHNHLSLHLDPLSRSATGELLEALSGRVVRPEVVAAFHTRSGGNPFYVEELVALLDGQGPPPGSHDHDVLDGPGGLGSAGGEDDDGPGMAITRAAAFPETLPDNLRGLVAARLDDLDVGPRSVLQDAAVLGGRGMVEALERLAQFLNRGMGVAEALAVLVAHDLIEVDGQRWSFRSDLVREVAYQTITKSDRATRHEAIATYLEHHVAVRDPRPAWVVDQLAHHYAEAALLMAEMGAVNGSLALGADIDASARRWVVEAAEQARADMALPTARRHYQKALDLIGPDRVARPSESVLILVELASLSLSLWDQECANRHIAEAAELVVLADEPTLRAEVEVVCGLVQQREGRPDDAIASLTAAAVAFGEQGDHEGQARALRERAQVEILDGRLDQAERSALEALTEFEHVGDRSGQGWAHQNLAWIAFVSGRTGRAAEHASSAVDLFAELDDSQGIAWAWGVLAWIRFQQGQVGEARELAVKARDRALTLSDPWAIAVTELLLAAAMLWEGDTAGAVDLATAVMATFDRLGDTWGRGQAGAVLGRALTMIGRVDEGLALLDQVGASGGITAVPTGQMARVTRGAVAVQIGQPELAEDVEGDLRVLADHGSQEAATALGILALQRGDPDLAAGYLRRDEVGEVSANLYAGRALLAAVTGRGDLEESAEAVGSRPGATYLDRGFVSIARALDLARAIQARSEVPPEEVEGASTMALAEVDGAIAVTASTGDVLSSVVFSLAGARIASALGHESARSRTEAVEERLVDLNIDSAGWRTLFDLAVAARADR